MKPAYPFKTLGVRLKQARQRSSQTLGEVSGAVEIDEKHLAKIEAGQIRPTEELLELLSNHFKLSDEETIKLLELAGYNEEDPSNHYPDIEGGLSRTIIMLLSQDNKIVYTDGLDIHYDTNGLLLNFKQSVGQSKPVSVAKLGMSYEQALQVQKTLSRVLLHAKNLKDPKSLPKSSSSSDKA